MKTTTQLIEDSWAAGLNAVRDHRRLTVEGWLAASIASHSPEGCRIAAQVREHGALSLVDPADIAFVRRFELREHVGCDNLPSGKYELLFDGEVTARLNIGPLPLDYVVESPR